jgi:DNA primase
MDNIRLHPDTIEEVKQKVDIVETIGEYVVLKKRGKDFQGLCPFHQEKTPSFTVSVAKQMYYCFGCQAGGNAIGFLMELGKRSFSEAVLDLAHKYQIPIQTLEPEKQREIQRQISQREQLYEILGITAKFYQHALEREQGAAALNYLKVDRLLSDETIQTFQLGYAPSGWSTLLKYLTEQKKLPIELVKAAGLIVPRKDSNGYYDRFRDRLMIPIRDPQGRTIGFGGRTLTDEQPKYLNSPETELFDKGRTLYALDRAKDKIIKTDRAVVVEGYFDAIALHAKGIENAVASLGTALSLHQVKQLVKYSESKQIVLNFDADRAGNIAAERAIGEIADLAYQGQVQLRILNLPAGKDADEFLKQNDPDAYISLLDRAPLWIDWQIDNIVADRDLTQAEQYQQAVSKIVKLLDEISDPTTRTHYLQKTASLLSNGDARTVPLLIENLQTELKRLARNVKAKQSTNRSPEVQVNYETDTNTSDNAIAEIVVHPTQELLDRAEALLLRVYLHFPDRRLEIIDALDGADLIFTMPHHRWLWQQIIARYQTGEIDYHDDLSIDTLQDLALNSDGEFNRIRHLFILDERTAQEIQRSPLVIRAAIACLEKLICERQRKYYLDKWQSVGQDNAEGQLRYYELFYQAQQRLQELEKQRTFTISDLLAL